MEYINHIRRVEHARAKRAAAADAFEVAIVAAWTAGVDTKAIAIAADLTDRRIQQIVKGLTR